MCILFIAQPQPIFGIIMSDSYHIVIVIVIVVITIFLLLHH